MLDTEETTLGSVASDVKRQEKEDTLEVVLKVKQYLEEQNIKVILTRKEDTYVSLKKRCKIANRKKADLFVSVHRNSSETQKPNGIEIWISKDADEISEKLAMDIMRRLESTNLQSNRGIKEGTSENQETNYYVNQNTEMPSCLVELGFISNSKDNQLLDENIEQYAKAIAEGILENVEKEE